MSSVKEISKPCVILAGAGTGKTYTIVEKVKYILENKLFNPEKIVCITFSNEAANNLYTRIKSFSEEEPIIKTFHSFSADLLRKYGEEIGIKTNFSVLSPDDSKILLHKYFGVLPNNCHRYIETISIAKDLGIGVEVVENYLMEQLKLENSSKEKIEECFQNMHLELQNLNFEFDKNKKKEFSEKMKKFSTLNEIKNFITSWKSYEKIKKINNYQDYSDLNLNALDLLRRKPEIAQEFEYVVVDEFQDTNKVQLDFLFYLAPKGNITVVGDLNQSIYRFRGAYKENLNLFKEKFGISDSEVFNLDKSYRSSNKILNVAHKLILNNYSDPTNCFEVFNVNGREGDNIEVYEMKNAKEEARKVVELVENEIKNGKKYEDICVMFRTHQQGRIIKNYLDYKNIPFISVSKESLLKNTNIKLTIDFLKIIFYLSHNRKGGEQAWWDLIYHKGFQEQDLAQIGIFIKKNLNSDCLSKKIFEELGNLDLSSNGKIIAVSLVKQIKKLWDNRSEKVVDLIKEIYSVLEFDGDNKSEMMNLNKFYEIGVNYSLMHYSDLASFVNYLDILDILGIHIDSASTENGGVRLMTIHSTKGLEFDTVIITNLAQKRFPIERVRVNPLLPLKIYPEIKNIVDSFGSDSEEEIKKYSDYHQLLEERRLCYVSFTRAKNKLILTYAKEYGGKKFFPSEFLKEIDYTKNSFIDFSCDVDEKYQEPEVKISSRFSLKNPDKVKVEEKNDFVLSPSALILFKKCQKQFEYKYVFKMPEPRPFAWEEIRLGSFVHLVLEKGVSANLRSEEDFISLAKRIQLDEEWRSVNLDEAVYLIKIFYQRNKNKFNQKSKTEQILKIKIGGLKFVGFADRIDFTPKGIEIIDYKTGRSKITAQNRNFQLGYYAIAAKKFGKVHKITLDMLRDDFPIEFVVDDFGVAKCGRVSFNLNDVENEILQTANEIKNALSKGFVPCSPDKNCEFCEEWVYKN
jgi:DNA helicase II / ATP-dependent DNA helicase PcrA